MQALGEGRGAALGTLEPVHGFMGLWAHGYMGSRGYGFSLRVYGFMRLSVYRFMGLWASGWRMEGGGWRVI